MKRRFIILGILIAILIVSTGCWNRRELNDLAIELAMGIDKYGDQYRLTSQVVDPGEVAARAGGGARTPVITYQATADNPFEARRKMTTISPRKIYASHIRVVVISEKLARKGISGILDYLSRDHEHRTDFFIVVAKGTSAENALKILTPLEKIPANKLFSSLDTSEKTWAPTVGVTLDELISDIVSKGKQPVLTGLQVKGNQEIGESKENVEKLGTPSQLQYSGIGVFKEDKLIGWLNEKESKGYNYITDNVKSTVGHVTCPNGGEIALEVMNSNTNVKGKVKHGNPQIDIDTNLELNVGTVDCKIDLMNTKTIAELEKRVGQKTKSTIEQAINAVQEKYQVDIFGFGEVIRRSDSTYWKKVKNNWDEEFVDLPVHVKTNVKIRRVGTIGESLEDGKE